MLISSLFINCHPFFFIWKRISQKLRTFLEICCHSVRNLILIGYLREGSFTRTIFIPIRILLSVFALVNVCSLPWGLRVQNEGARFCPPPFTFPLAQTTKHVFMALWSSLWTSSKVATKGIPDSGISGRKQKFDEDQEIPEIPEKMRKFPIFVLTPHKTPICSITLGIFYLF